MLCQCLEDAEQEVTPELQELSRLAGGVPKSRGKGGGKGTGLGFGSNRTPQTAAHKQAAAWGQRLQQHVQQGGKPQGIGERSSQIQHNATGSGERHHTMSQFKSAGSEGQMYVPPSQPPPFASSAQPPPFAPGIPPPSTNPSIETGRKRKSRWDQS